MFPIWVYRAVGAGSSAAGTHTIFDNWKVEVAIAVGGSFLPRSIADRFIVEIGKTVLHRAPLAARTVAIHSARAIGWVGQKTGITAALTRSLVATTSVVASITVGYMIGAVAGTFIAGKIWGKSGQRHALDFYTGKGAYGEYFDIVGNVNTIYNAYFGGSS